MNTNITSKMSIENESWTLAKLYDTRHYITKPKFQRDKTWTVLPKKTNIPNYYDYIQFLITNKNSVFPISLGTEIKDGEVYYIVIDGNNRLNAIISFLDQPYIIFSEFYETLFNIINTSDAHDTIKHNIINCIKKLNYRSISNFRRLDTLLKEFLPTFNDKDISTELFRNVENEFINVQAKLLFNDNSAYDKNIRLNINKFNDGKYEEYSKIFEDINKHSNILSENELLSAILFTTNINIDGIRSIDKSEILQQIEIYYNSRQDEVLTQFVYNANDNINTSINAFDFMIGLQNYYNKKYPVIHKFDSTGLSIFFKIYKYLYDTLDKNSFTRDNIIGFITYMNYACKNLNDAVESIFPKNVNNIFNKAYVKCENDIIKKNNLLMMLISNIANCKLKDDDASKISDKDLIKKNKACIIYHLLCNKIYVKENTQLEHLKTFDCILYIAGESFIKGQCMNILNKGPSIMFNKLNKEEFKKLLEQCIESSITESEFGQKAEKRRKLTLLDKILIANFWNKNIPNKYLNKEYSLEHIIPFSSVYEGTIDLDRIGNIFPTFNKINSERGNKDLEIYKKQDFYPSIKKLLPANYNRFNKMENKKTIITSIQMYNEHSKKNEGIYIQELIDDIFSR